MAPKRIASISHIEREELRKKGIKSPSKLFSPKYLSLVSIKELNKNSSVPKRVHFVNSIVVLSKDEAKDQGKGEDEMGTAEEVEELFEDEESEIETEEVEEVFDDETEEEDDDTKYYNSPLLLKSLYIMNGS
ncbi:hypothetical protein Tco_0981988 [Tanacetum coccineum]